MVCSHAACVLRHLLCLYGWILCVPDAESHVTLLVFVWVRSPCSFPTRQAMGWSPCVAPARLHSPIHVHNLTARHLHLSLWSLPIQVALGADLTLPEFRHVSPVVVHLIAEMLHPDPNVRPTTSKILHNKWVTGGKCWNAARPKRPIRTRIRRSLFPLNIAGRICLRIPSSTRPKSILSWSAVRARSRPHNAATGRISCGRFALCRKHALSSHKKPNQKKQKCTTLQTCLLLRTFGTPFTPCASSTSERSCARPSMRWWRGNESGASRTP